jgi:hypothetical protein
VSLPLNTTAKTHSPDGSLTSSEMGRRHLTWLDEQPLIVSCAFCGWRLEAPAADARAAAAAHRAEAHPDLAPSGRKKSRKTREIETARAKRAEREDEQRLVKVEQGRQREELAAASSDFGSSSEAGGAQPTVLEEVAAVDDPVVSGAGDKPRAEPERAAASSSTTRLNGGDRILALLAERPWRSTEMMVELEQAGVKRGTVSWWLHELVKRGAAVSPERGLYELPTVSEREPKAAVPPAEAVAGTTEPAGVSAAASQTAGVPSASRSETAGILRLLVRETRRVADAMEAFVEAYERELLDALEEEAA